jgi:hypothetical protein
LRYDKNRQVLGQAVHYKEDSNCALPEIKLRDLVPNFLTHTSVSDLYIIIIMYRRPILCTLYCAVDFLKVLKIAVVWGGGVLAGHSAYITSL